MRLSVVLVEGRRVCFLAVFASLASASRPWGWASACRMEPTPEVSALLRAFYADEAMILRVETAGNHPLEKENAMLHDRLRRLESVAAARPRLVVAGAAAASRDAPSVPGGWGTLTEDLQALMRLWPEWEELARSTHRAGIGAGSPRRPRPHQVQRRRASRVQLRGAPPRPAAGGVCASNGMGPRRGGPR